VTKLQKWALFGLRVTFGLYFLYNGIVKLIDPVWSAVGFLGKATTLSTFFSYLADPVMLPIVNFLVVWGFILIGLSLVVGVLVRVSAPMGALMMLLFYLPSFTAPYVSVDNFFIDNHIIYIFALLTLAAFDAGKVFGLAKPLKRFIYRKSSSKN